MKKNSKLIGMFIALLVFCGVFIFAHEKEIEAGDKYPFKTYNIKDKHGCNYVVVYDKSGTSGKSRAIAMAVSPNQPLKCK